LLTHPDARVKQYDPAHATAFIDECWVTANTTPAIERSSMQESVLADSDQRVAELRTADVIVLTVPVYNFSVPAALKAWIDMIFRADLTFRYTEKGPQGLLADRPVYIVMATGGVPFGSAADFASGYLRHIFNFIGIRNVRFIYAEATNIDASASESAALEMMAQWLPMDAARAVA
jgi:FMN-dependent NADH-azoreductase